MTTPTRQEIIDAHDALEILYDLVEVLSFTDSETCLARKHCASVLAALPPRPRPTMADVEWDDDKHYLAEAEVGEIKLVMLQPDLVGWIRCFDPESGKVMPAIEPEDVTPTGRRYTLTEVQE